MPKTVNDIRAMKGTTRISALATYDYQTASMLDEAGVDLLLVGDSVGNVVYGHDNTLSVTMDIMIAHTQAVSAAAKNALVVGDMPFGSYQPSCETAVRNAARFLSEGKANAVKLEGGRHMAETVKRLVACGIPVMGHVGLTPQSVQQLGGYRMQGKEGVEADKIVCDAKAVAEAGAFSLVLECVEPALAAEITRLVPVPTIGIGSGPGCDGQILVVNDLLGLTVAYVPKFVKPLADLRESITDAARRYVERVRKGA